MPKRSAGMFPSLEHACAALRHGTRRTERPWTGKMIDD